jgi:hypothetical protein
MNKFLTSLVLMMELVSLLIGIIIKWPQALTKIGPRLELTARRIGAIDLRVRIFLFNVAILGFALSLGAVICARISFPNSDFMATLSILFAVIAALSGSGWLTFIKINHTTLGKKGIAIVTLLVFILYADFLVFMYVYLTPIADKIRK